MDSQVLVRPTTTPSLSVQPRASTRHPPVHIMGEFIAKTLYFAYGSNFWLDQMNRRCPGSKFIGTAILHDWKWFINMHGYANVIPSEGDIVYGMIYELTADDEDKLDGFELVPIHYIKRILAVEIIHNEGSLLAIEKKNIDALVYVDVERVIDGPPKEEYITRINMAVADAMQKGIPKDYIDKYVRPFIPAQTSQSEEI